MVLRENSIISENFGESHQQRFNRAIYLTYVEQDRYMELKSATKKEFYEKIYSKNLGKRTIRQLDKSRIYRLADEHEVWRAKHSGVLGEIWREDDVESYWLNYKLKESTPDKNIVGLSEVGWYAKRLINAPNVFTGLEVWEIFSVDENIGDPAARLVLSINTDKPTLLAIMANPAMGVKAEKIEWDFDDILNAIRYVFLKYHRH